MIIPRLLPLQHPLLASIDVEDISTSRARDHLVKPIKSGAAIAHKEGAQPTSKGLTSGFEHSSQKETGHAAKRLPAPEQEQLLSSGLSEQEEDIMSEATLDTRVAGEPLESDAADTHPSSPSEDFSSYVQMVSRMAKTLKMDTEQSPPPAEDLVFGDINQERYHP